MNSGYFYCGHFRATNIMSLNAKWIEDVYSQQHTAVCKEHIQSNKKKKT